MSPSLLVDLFISFTKTQTRIPLTAHIAEVIKKTFLYPNASAIKPPRNGPSKLPAAVELARNPIAYPDLSLGVLEETSASAAAIKPLRAPCTILKMKSCTTSCDNPTRNWETASPKIALRTIFFLPTRSPSQPHTGVAINAVIKTPETTSPLHLLVRLFPLRQVLSQIMGERG